MKKYIIAAIVLFATSTSSASGLSITGTRIFTEEKLKKDLNLHHFDSGKISISNVESLIKDYYKSRGYNLVQVYLIEKENDQTLIYIDEGRLGKIIFLYLSGFDTLRVKNEFELEKNIFNTNKLKNSIDNIQKKFGFHSITYRVTQSPEFEESLFQLDRDLKIPVIGTAWLPFLDQVSRRYDLEIYIIKHPPFTDKDENGINESRIDYKLRLNLSSGLMPELIYHKPALFNDGDLFETSVSIGIFYGLDLDFDSPPELRFFKTASQYIFAPIKVEIFTPMLKGLFFISDEGIQNYHLINLIAAPGFTFQKQLKLYAGAGIEIAKFSNNDIDFSNSNPGDIEIKKFSYKIFESELKLEVIPIRLGNIFNKNATITYSYYNGKTSFHKLSVKSTWDFVFSDMAVYSISASYNLNIGDVPFYHESPVKNHSFRGLDGYLTNNTVSMGNEYRLSVYREFISLGFYGDITFFKSTGDYDSVSHKGFSAGPTLRIIFLDQFELYCHVGKDLLLPEKFIGTTLSMRLSKKW